MGFNISNMRFCRVRKSTDMVTANATPVACTFDTAIKNVNNMWEGVTNPTRITANRPGWYRVFGQVEWAANATGDRGLQIRKNGSATVILAENIVKSGALAAAQQIEALVYLGIGDYVELFLNQTSTGALNLTATAAKESPSLSVHLVLPEVISSGAFERD
jgi:hypothetical protein